MRRSWLVAVAGAAVFAGCARSDDSSSPSPPPEARPAWAVGVEDTGTSLAVRRWPLAEGVPAPPPLFEVTDDEAVIALGKDGRTAFAVVRDARPQSGGEDFDGEPLLRLHDAGGKLLARLGRGTAPALSPDGRRLAWAVPRGRRVCAPGRGCPKQAHDVVSVRWGAWESPRRIGTLSDVAGLAWGRGNDVLAVTVDGSVLRMRAGRGPERVRMRGRLLDAGPDGRLATAAEELTRLAVQDTAGREMWFRLLAPFRAAARLSPDGGHVLLQLVRTRDDGSAEGAIEVVDAETGHGRRAPEARASGELLWSQRSQWFAYRRDAGAGFELVVCRTAAISDCATSLKWPGGRQLLRLEPAVRTEEHGLSWKPAPPRPSRGGTETAPSWTCGDSAHSFDFLGYSALTGRVASVTVVTSGVPETVGIDGVVEAVEHATATWNEERNRCGRPDASRAEFRITGLTETHPPPVDDGLNTVSFATGTCARVTHVACTYRHQHPDTGEPLGWDIVLDPAYPWGRGGLDVRAVLTHEFGHVVGLAHVGDGLAGCDFTHAFLVMYPCTWPGDTTKHVLGLGDALGLETLSRAE